MNLPKQGFWKSTQKESSVTAMNFSKRMRASGNNLTNLSIMKKSIFLFFAAVFAFAACQETETYTPAGEDLVLSAHIEQGMQTKTEMGEGNSVLWSEGDQIAAFMKSSASNQYQILSSFVGKSYADFSILQGNEPAVGADWEHIIAYYPYSSSVKCTKSDNGYLLDVVIPSEQSYVPGSFANGAFPMVAVSADNNIAFKNVCGGIKLQFKGSANVASVSIRGKNNEKLSGAASVTANGDGAAPAINMAASASATATLKCTPSVQLSETTATEFIISLPPVDFSNGFTVVVTDTDSRTYTVETGKSNSVVRSSLLVMPEVTLVRDVTVADNLSGWTNVTSNYGTLPEYISIYKSPSTLQGKSAVAYIAVADIKRGASWDVWSIQADKTSDGWLDYSTSDPFVTPTGLYNSTYWGNPPVIINGGFFYSENGKNYTASLAKREWGDPLSYNINYEFDTANQTCYPTRAAFLEGTDGSFDACWTYVLWNYEHYTYPAPSTNVYTQPGASFPAGGKVFAAKTAIGGGPVLINNGMVINSWSQEMLSGIDPTSSQPRTAIGVTAQKEIVFFVCEGRGVTSGVYGFTTAEVANILKSMGCVEAINLDGGGSSCMLVNGISTIKESDGSQRAVANAVILR